MIHLTEEEPSIQPPSIQVARTILEALISRGVRHVAYCPGSRNAPFAYTLAAAEDAGLVCVETFSDERSAGFWAVGAAKGIGNKTGSKEAVAVITTSGTAAAELYPALREAHHQGLSVLAVTADRPHEYRQVGASQTTDQERLYGSAVIADVSIPAEEHYSKAHLRQIRGQVQRIVALSGRTGQSGPAHLNVAFREPLVPSGPVAAPAQLRAETPRVVVSVPAHPRWEDIIAANLRTVVVAGDGADPVVVREADRRGVPILAEPSSLACHLSTWVPHAPFVVPFLEESVEQVVVTGKPSLSRPIAALLGRPSVRKVVVAKSPWWNDVAGTASVVAGGMTWQREIAVNLDAAVQSQDEFSQGMPAEAPKLDLMPAHPMTQRHGTTQEDAGRPYLRRWREVSDLVREVLDELPDLNLLTACQSIWASQTGELLWLGASNAVRGFEMAASVPRLGEVYSNRGLAGIDGTIASAAGLASGSGQPVRAVMGDLTFTADLSTLPQRLEGSPDLQVIVFDDKGGSIFASLEHGEERFRHLYERFFAVPPQINGPAVAEACGWETHEVNTLQQLEAELGRPVRGRSILWVNLARPAQLIRQVTSRLADRLAAPLRFEEKWR